MATISIPLARELGVRHRAAGLAYVAAPVFGRPELATDGKLTIVAAGDPAGIARVEPLLGVMGQRTWRVGAEPEHANVVKLAGNLVLAAAVEAMAEASVLAWRNGVAPAELLDILTNGVFTAPAYKIYGAAIAEQRYQPAGFRLALVLKDVRLALAAADVGRIPMPLASVVHDALLEAVAHDDGDLDLAALATVAMRHAGADPIHHTVVLPADGRHPADACTGGRSR
jgi:3-hydroxyisobutyrate dehydrogenase-like beta-hydroxyacid dehydrogenase